ncbi:MAG: Gx transporter family protein [Oscillospiraceae bacterium]|nr:Gx transporter family protein [Oscillospiraceae bacterium]
MRDKKTCRGGIHAARRPLTPAQKAAHWGILSALALALSWAESFLAPFLNLPMGVKPGLSNIAVMMACAALGLPAGLAVAAAKAVFAGLTRGLTAMLLSASGGIVSALLVGLLLKFSIQHSAFSITETGVGMLGGAAHNMAQLAVAALLMGTPGVFWAAPWLLICGAIAGAVTGTAVRLIRRHVRQ